MGVVAELHSTENHIIVLVALLTVSNVFFYMYYPLTRKFDIDYVSTHDTQGIPVTQRYKSLEWYMNQFHVVSIIPIFLAMFMCLRFTKKWIKILFIIYLALTLCMWLSFIVIRASWINHKNNPLDPNNPASSDARCCTSEYYTAVPSCRNYERLDPVCSPPYALSDLGLNKDEVVVMCFLVACSLMWAFFLYFTVHMMRLVSELELQEIKAKATQTASGTTTTITTAPASQTTVVNLESKQFIPAPIHHQQQQFLPMARTFGGISGSTFSVSGKK